MRHFLLVVFGLHAVLLSSITRAELLQNLFIDTKAMSLANAVTADPTGILDIHFNPAGLTKLDGRQFQLNLQSFVIESTAEFNLPEGYEQNSGSLLDISEDPILNEGDSEADVGLYIPGYGAVAVPLPIVALPSVGVSIKPPGSKFTFANAAYFPMAANLFKDNDDPGRYQAREIALQRFTYFSPSFGYQVNDEFSVGLSVLFSHQAIWFEQDIRAPNILVGVLEELQDAFCAPDANGEFQNGDPLAPLLTLCAGNIGPYDDVGVLNLDLTESLSPSYNLGMLWEPNSWFKFGMAYQSEAKSQLTGEFSIDYDPDFYEFFRLFRSSIVGAIGGAIFNLPTGVARESGYASTEFTYPQHFQAGVKFKYFDIFHFNFDMGWTDFDKMDALELKFDRPVSFLSTAQTLSPELVTPTTLTMPLNFESVWNYKIGMAMDLNSRIQLRCGIEPRNTAIPKENRSLMAPVGFGRLYSVGLGYRWDLDTTIDLSASFLEMDQDINADPTNAGFDDEFPNSSNSLNRDCLTCLVTNPYPGLDVDTQLRIMAAGISFRTKF